MDAKIEKLKELAASSRAGSRRINRKDTHKTSSVDDTKLMNKISKELGTRQFPGIDEVNFFKADNNVIHFSNPKVQVGRDVFVVSGNHATKSLMELAPGIFQHLGQESINILRQIAQMQATKGGLNDDDVPNLVGNFDQQ